MTQKKISSMEDKLTKVKAEIERRIAEVNLDSIEDWRYRLQREHDIELMKSILSIIDSPEEEPKSFNEAIQEGDDVRYNEDLGCRVNLSQLKRVAKKDPRYCIYSKDDYTDEDRKTLCDGCEEECEFKPVSEGLEKTIDDYLATYFGGEKEKQYWPFLKKMAMYFSKLQNHLMTSFIEFYRNEHIKAAESAETERDKAMHQYAADICGVMLTQLNGQVIVKED